MKEFNARQMWEVFQEYNREAGLMGSKSLPGTQTSIYPWVNRIKPVRKQRGGSVVITSEELKKFAKSILDQRDIPFDSEVFDGVIKEYKT